MAALITLWEGTELEPLQEIWKLRYFLAVGELKEYGNLCHLKDMGICAWGNLTVDP